MHIIRLQRGAFHHSHEPNPHSAFGKGRHIVKIVRSETHIGVPFSTLCVHFFLMPKRQGNLWLILLTYFSSHFNFHGKVVSLLFNPGHTIATTFCAWHNSVAVLSCAEICNDRFIRIWTRTKLNPHHILIVMDKVLMRRVLNHSFDDTDKVKDGQFCSLWLCWCIQNELAWRPFGFSD